MGTATKLREELDWLVRTIVALPAVATERE